MPPTSVAELGFNKIWSRLEKEINLSRALGFCDYTQKTLIRLFKSEAPSQPTLGSGQASLSI